MSAKQSEKVKIRWMVRRDMAEVLAIEQECFEYPWYEEDFIRCLRQRNCIGMVAEVGKYAGLSPLHKLPNCVTNCICGFMVYELHKTRLNLLNFAVGKSAQGEGVGRAMMEKLLSKLSGQRRTTLSLEVRETNMDALLFFKAMGFRAVRVFRDYYDDNEEDMILMQYRFREGAVV